MRPDSDIPSFEFSDYGRNARFVSGWWIVPGLVMVSILLLACVAG